MEKIYQFIVWASIFFYWLLIAGVTIRVVLKRRALGVSIAWLMIIYIIPIVGVILYLLFGELNLGRKRAERAKAMFAPYGEWMETVNECEAHRPQHQVSWLVLCMTYVCAGQAFLHSRATNLHYSKKLQIFYATSPMM